MERLPIAQEAWISPPNLRLADKNQDQQRPVLAWSDERIIEDSMELTNSQRTIKYSSDEWNNNVNDQLQNRRWQWVGGGHFI